MKPVSKKPVSSWGLGRGLIVSSLVAVGLAAGVALAQGGSISGFVIVPDSITNRAAVVVLACADSDPMCAKPVQVLEIGQKAGIKTKDATKIPYSFVRLPAGKYTLYALNDTTANLQHDFETEEIGGYFTPGTFDPILVTPPAREVNLELIPLQ